MEDDEHLAASKSCANEYELDDVDPDVAARIERRNW